MSNWRAVGIETLKIGAYNSTTNAMPTTFTTVTAIVQDSAKLVFESPEPTDFFTEESDVVDVEILGTGKKGFEFATYDMGNPIFLLAFGGSTSGSSLTTAVWKAPTTATLLVERSVQITTKSISGKKLRFEIPHASIRAGGELKFSKTAPGSITISGTVLKAGSNPPMKRTLV